VRLSTARSLLLFSLIGLAFLSLTKAIATSNSIPETGVDEDHLGISPDELKPSECNGINLTGVIGGDGLVFGTGGNDLILGGSGNEWILALGGDNCVLAGNGNDVIWGGWGDDVLLGQGGDDTLRGNNGNDICYGGSGTDTADSSCETTYGIP
jgi:Ca2+-binding RTX toxin-like protein